MSEKLCVWKRLSTKVVGWVYLCGGLHLEDKGGWQSRARGRPSENNQQWGDPWWASQAPWGWGQGWVSSELGREETPDGFEPALTLARILLHQKGYPGCWLRGTP